METFDTSLEAQVLVELWRRYYKTVSPHCALDYRPLALEADIDQAAVTLWGLTDAELKHMQDSLEDLRQ